MTREMQECIAIDPDSVSPRSSHIPNRQQETEKTVKPVPMHCPDTGGVQCTSPTDLVLRRRNNTIAGKSGRRAEISKIEGLARR